MKIAMIGHKRVPSREGGVEIAVWELAVRMSHQGHEITLYNRAGRHFHAKEYDGVKIITVPTLEHRSLNALVYSALATLHAVFCGYDVIHYHAEGPSAMLKLASIFGGKTVSTVHGLDWQRGKWGGFASKYLRFGEKILARHADGVIVLTESAQTYFRENHGRETSLIPNGITPPQRREPDLIAQKYGLVGGDYLLFLARLVPEKGLHYLLNAFKNIDTNLRLVVAGGESHTEKYAAEMANMASLDSRVVMTGFVEGVELEELYSNCALYILPSDVEGMPLSLLEAMSLGRRCLTSDIPECTSVTCGFGASFERGNVDDLTTKLQDFITGKIIFPDENDISNHVLQKFNWDRAAKQTMALYGSILGVDL